MKHFFDYAGVRYGVGTIPRRGHKVAFFLLNGNGQGRLIIVVNKYPDGDCPRLVADEAHPLSTMVDESMAATIMSLISGFVPKMQVFTAQKQEVIM